MRSNTKGVGPVNKAYVKGWAEKTGQGDQSREDLGRAVLGRVGQARAGLRRQS